MIYELAFFVHCTNSEILHKAKSSMTLDMSDRVKGLIRPWPNDSVMQTPPPLLVILFPAVTHIGGLYRLFAHLSLTVSPTAAESLIVIGPPQI
jgi:hypothetical protein